MNSKGDILIAELDYGGHRANHVGIITRHLRSLGIEPKLLTSQQSIDQGGFDHLDLETSCFDQNSQNPAVAMPFYARCFPSALRDQVRIFRQISGHLNLIQNTTRCVIFPTLQAAGLIPAGLSQKGFPVPWVGVVMAPGPHLRAHGIDTHHSALELWVQRRSYRGLVKQPNCLGIGSFDPLFVQWINQPNVTYCPDPVSIVCSAQVDGLIADTDKPVILIAGSIDERKKVCELAEILEQVSRDHPLHLMIAGKPTDKIRPKLENSPAIVALQRTNSVDLILRRLSDSEMDFLFQRADIVWSGNLRTYGSSGAVVRAGMHGKPVVTMHKSVLGNWMQSVNGGPVVDLTSPSELLKVFKRLVSDADFRDSLGRQNFQLFGENTEQKYCEILLGPLKLSDAPAEVSHGKI